MAYYDKLVEATKEYADDIAYKVKNFDVKAFWEEVKGLDVGVAYTQFLDALAKLDLAARKQAIIDFLDSPEMDALKEKARMVGDFCGYVPYYAQSVPEMLKELVEKKSKK